MTPHALSRLHKEDVKLFLKVRDAINHLPNIDLGVDGDKKKIVLSCHILARAVAIVFDLELVSGYLYPDYEHSWVTTPNGNIIDVYPVGVFGGPFLVDGTEYSPSRWHYLRNDEKILSRVGFDKPSFKLSVQKIVCALSKTKGLV